MDKQIAENEGAFVDLLNQEMKELQESQKQIEEMAKIMEKTFSYAKKHYDDKYEPFELEVYPDEIASELYNSGCRKIPEDVVLLTQSEKQKLLHEMYEQGRFDAIADLEKDGKVMLTREEYENLNLKLFEYEVSISRDYVQQDIFDEVLDEKIDKENENYFLHDKVKALEELVGALRSHIEAYKEQVEALKEFNDVFCKKTRKETAEKFAERLKADVSEDDELHEALNYYLKRDYFEYIDERCKEITDGKV